MSVPYVGGPLDGQSYSDGLVARELRIPTYLQETGRYRLRHSPRRYAWVERSVTMAAARDVLDMVLRDLTPPERLAVLMGSGPYREAAPAFPSCRCRQGDQPRLLPPETAVGEDW